MNALSKQFSAIIQRQLKDEYTSVSYAIMQHGKLMASDSLGYKNRKDLQPADEKCTYNVASVSKIFCTTAVMQLVEQGKLALDTPVCTYLPQFVMPLDARYRDITLRQCLSHSSGLPGTQWRGFSVSSVKDTNYYADVLDFFAKSTLKAAPGTYSVYCNDGFTLAELCVAEVSGMSYAEYCKQYITEPLEMHSSRLSPVLNPEYTVVSEGKKPAELLLIEGGAGYTTTMTDLVTFGNTFLHESPILQRTSMDEMAKPQGKTFLKTDERSPLYGLGWDTVQYRDPDFDLGEGVLLKGGNSFQFDTQFFVIPKYDAVLAISETHDCGLNINAIIMRLFATMMLQQGVNIYTKYQPIPQEIIDRYAGTYLLPSLAVQLHMDGAVADVVRMDVRKKGGCLWQGLHWNGKEFENRKDETQFLFDEDGEDKFIMMRFRSYVTGAAMKAHDFPTGPAAWEARVGKRYLPCTIDANDEVVYEDMHGLRIEKLNGFNGLYTFSFSGRTHAGVYGVFESTVHAVDDNRGQCYLRTPANPSRDLIDPIFHMEDGVEYCDAASYTFRDVASLADYHQQPFPEKARENGVYHLGEELKELPKIPAGHRIIVLDDDLISVYDSLFDENFTSVKAGYIILI